jgi:hypothetical protein
MAAVEEAAALAGPPRCRGWHGKLGHQLAHREGQLGCCPFRIESRRIGASCWRRDRKRSIHFLRALYDIPRTREPLGEQPRAHHLIFHRKTFRSQKHNLSASAACQVGEHPFYAPHATIRSYVRIKSKRQSTTTLASCDGRHTYYYDGRTRRAVRHKS